MSMKGKVPEGTPIDAEERREVRRALKLMRKACVKQSKSQQELSKYSGGSDEVDKKSLLPYSEKLEVVIKDFDALMSDAKVNYSLVLEKKKFQLASMKLGKPRQIFPHLVAEIVNDEEERLYKEKHPEVPDPNILIIVPTAVTPVGKKKQLDPLPSPTSKQQSDMYNSNTSPLQGENDDLSLGKRMSLSTTISKINLKSTIGSQKARKEMLLKQKEDELKQSLENRNLLREEEGRRIEEAQRKLFLRKGTLLYVSILSFLEPLKTKLLAYRKEIYDLKHASQTEKSVRFISNWWYFKRLELILFRNKKSKDVIRVFVCMGWGNIQRKKRNKSADLCKMFIKDSTGLSETVRKVYAFRKKVICLQLHFKSWLAIAKARIQILWMTMDKIVKIRIENDRIEKMTKEKSALKAIAKLNGFGNKLLEMNTLKKNLDRLLTQQQKNMKKTLTSQGLEDEETNALTKSGLDTKINTGTMEKKLSMYAKSKESWWNRIAKDSKNKNKLRLIQYVLQKQRLRHIASITEETKNELVVVRLDVSHAKDLLKLSTPKADNAMKSGSKKTKSTKAALVRAKTQKNRLEEAQKFKRAPNPFLMLTKGGLADLEEITTTEWLKTYKQDL